MVSRVAVVKTDMGVSEAYQRALDLIGGIDDLKANDRDVTIKVGVYDPRNLNYTTVEVLRAVVGFFSNQQMIRIAESDNHEGRALRRLQIWKDVYSDRITPFDLSHDPHTSEVLVCEEKIQLSKALFKPNILISLHVLREGTAGSIFKNLLGLVPDTRKERFHSRLGVALVDIAKAVGWIDLAVIDGTYLYGSQWKEGEPLERRRKDLLLVGRDPVAVETVGSIFAGEEPRLIPSITIAKERMLGETDIAKIEVLGEPMKGLL